MADSFEHYENLINDFGASARGVAWKNEEAQLVRFEQLVKLVDSKKSFSINDLGCGVGDFVAFLEKKEMSFTYNGYDLMPRMIQLAKTKLSNQSNVSLQVIQRASEMNVADYSIASGIFNIKFGNQEDYWLQYILETLSAMNEKSKIGFAFNILTKYSDIEFMKEDLYYADPCFLFDHCKKNFSKNVALLHDYDQYDFTLLIRKSY